jgi:hypothetical protein
MGKLCAEFSVGQKRSNIQKAHIKALSHLCSDEIDRREAQGDISEGENGIYW